MFFEIEVPASSANLGPGFDSLAIALGLYLRVTIDTDAGAGTSSNTPDLLGDDLVQMGIHRIGELLDRPLPEYSIAVDSAVPIARGLGSSAAALVAGLKAGVALLDDRSFNDDDLVSIGGEIEGHADNVSAAILGGVTAAIRADGGYLGAQIASSIPWETVVYIPDEPALTREARRILPDDVPLADAAANVGNTALLVQAIHTGDNDLLGWAMRDRLHQPYRSSLFSHLEPMIDAGTDAGAGGACLSGAGPTVLFLVHPDRVEAVVERVSALAEAMRFQGTVERLPVDAVGATIRRHDTESGHG